MSALRAGLPDLPARMRALPIDARGYPTPWFVAEREDGERDFRMADGAKRRRAVKHDLCWVCGQEQASRRRMDRARLFVIGPMCAVNRVTSEPAVHEECAQFSVRACPFMLHPQAKYRDANMPPEHRAAPGIPLDRNPGVMALYSCESHKPFCVFDGWLIRLGEPLEIRWICQGRAATRDEVVASIDGGMPHLRAVAEQDGGRAPLELDYAYQRLMLEWVPA